MARVAPICLLLQTIYHRAPYPLITIARVMAASKDLLLPYRPDLYLYRESLLICVSLKEHVETVSIVTDPLLAMQADR